VLATTTACLSLTVPGDDHKPTGTFKVLLIGNSLTYENALPALLEALADSAGVEDLYVEMVAFPNYDLGLHLGEGSAMRQIRKGGWKYVVMQQGPTALPSSRDLLVGWAADFAPEIRAAGALPAFYAVWPSSSRSFDFDNVHLSYDAAAVAVQGALIPAGKAWQAAWAQDITLPLYAGDGFHPSLQGTYLAALVMLQRFYPGLDPVGLPSTVTLGNTRTRYIVDPTAAATLQAAAGQAHAQFGRAAVP